MARMRSAGGGDLHGAAHWTAAARERRRLQPISPVGRCPPLEDAATVAAACALSLGSRAAHPGSHQLDRKNSQEPQLTATGPSVRPDFREDECKRLLTRAAEGDGSGVEPRRRCSAAAGRGARRARRQGGGGGCRAGGPLSSSPLVLTPACICVGGGGRSRHRNVDGFVELRADPRHGEAGGAGRAEDEEQRTDDEDQDDDDRAEATAARCPGWAAAGRRSGLRGGGLREKRGIEGEEKVKGQERHFFYPAHMSELPNG
ncbi:hypothetical protein OsJ_31044 [Oryza sativa Japonica Group]|uniref:Uncharacterized protein n=1 Tax=Oryza sativa subsp. japonica TaxID=39947 RepID=A3C3H2_ORYSJ|nr:hypothetical protein OsJ_31044 [Oryza sativa Japonica Group]